MWQKSYSTIVSNILPSEIWKIWSDINMRPHWDDDTEWAKIEGPFQKNAIFYMKVKNGPKLKMIISECIPNKRFTDTYYFLFSRLDGVHEMEETSNGLRITTTMKLTGPLRWLWRKLVVEKIILTLPHQTELLIQLARKKGIK